MKQFLKLPPVVQGKYKFRKTDTIGLSGIKIGRLR
jgi:hypothetical protein